MNCDRFFQFVTFNVHVFQYSDTTLKPLLKVIIIFIQNNSIESLKKQAHAGITAQIPVTWQTVILVGCYKAVMGVLTVLQIQLFRHKSKVVPTWKLINYPLSEQIVRPFNSATLRNAEKSELFRKQWQIQTKIKSDSRQKSKVANHHYPVYDYRHIRVIRVVMYLYSIGVIKQRQLGNDSVVTGDKGLQQHQCI